MSNMDLKCKGITWAGNLYQKFEAMCLEVEDIVCEETTKYVENQVQSVGVSVRKFYAELMEDLLPPSSEDSEKSKEGIDGNPIIIESPTKGELPLPAKEMEKVVPDGKDLSRGPSFRVFPTVSHFTPSSLDSIKGTGSDLSREKNEESSVFYGKLNLGVEELTVEDKCSPKVLEAVASSENDLSGTSLFTRLHSENNDETCNMTAAVSTLTSVDVSQCNATQQVEKTRNEVLDAVDCISDVSSASLASLVLPDSFVENETGSGLMISSRGIPPIELNDNSKTYITISPVHDNGQKDGNDCAELDAVLTYPYNGRSDGYNVEEMASRSDKETVNACHHVKLEESCVLVDGDELHILSQRTGKNRSYKKKLRDAFASRIRSGKKQEYERLAVLCGDIDTGTDSQSAGSSQISTLTGAVDTEKSPVHDFCDSDWEIV